MTLNIVLEAKRRVSQGSTFVKQISSGVGVWWGPVPRSSLFYHRLKSHVIELNVNHFLLIIRIFSVLAWMSETTQALSCGFT